MSAVAKLAGVTARLLGRSPDRAGRAALDRYEGAGGGAEGHVAIRWLTCPMPAIEAVLPGSGTILEVGCGHGLFSLYAAEAGVERVVTGFDIDAAKIGHAQAAAAGLAGRVTFTAAQGGANAEIPGGPWDAIVIVDVLYLFEPAVAKALLAECARELAPGGVLVVKEMALRPRWKASWNRFQELLSVRVLRITEGAVLSFVSTDDVKRWCDELGLRGEIVRLDRRRLHPHAMVVAR